MKKERMLIRFTHSTKTIGIQLGVNRIGME